MSHADGQPADRRRPREVLRQDIRYVGPKWRLVTDQVRLDPSVLVSRDVVQHPGAVGVLALDGDENVVLIQQYRHPVASELWEIPAGLLDSPGESPWDTARRELFEEAHLRASRWDLLVDLYSSPGMSSEAIRIYLARELSEVPADERHEQTEEERDMPVRRVPLGSAVDLAVGGRLHNAMAVTALLAAAHARDCDWKTLRPPTTAWVGTE